MRELYERGLYVQAYREAEKIGPLRSWTGPTAKLLAGRLAMNVGAPRLGRRLHISAWRRAPDLAEARFYYTHILLERRGPLRAWQFLRESGEIEDSSPQARADWLGLHASVLCYFRDFDSAEGWLAGAEAMRPSDPWIAVERASLLRHQDRYEEALEAAERALAWRPWYRPAVQSASDLLVLLGRDGDALALLLEAAEKIESAAVLAQLASLQSELGHYGDEQRTLDRLEAYSPLLEKEGTQWLAARRSDVAYHLGHYAQAAEWATKVPGPFYASIAKTLADTQGQGKRVQLEVGFVRQHHRTCTPATLAAISRFWKKPVQHLEVAEAICYDGTPDHHERHWAESNGWVPREFTVTWESARALIDRGLPFTLTLTESTFAHLQAVIGYDSRRGTLLIRDPSERHFGEFDHRHLVERYRSTGPRGMVLAPADQAGRLLDGLELPDAPEYDQLHRIQRALEHHDRRTAARIYKEMKQAWPSHRLTLCARWILANYDRNVPGVLASIEELLQQFPGDAILMRAKQWCLRELGRREDRLALLRQAGMARDSDPVLWQLYAHELAADGREHVFAEYLIQRAIRYRFFDSGNLASLANIRLSQRHFAKALELFRFALCLNTTDEGLAWSYFSTARNLKQTADALRFLQNRFEQFGSQSGQPAQTLFWALDQLERMSEGFAVLERALALRPQDGELMIFAAEKWSLYGNHEKAKTLHAEAEGNCALTHWLRSQATLAWSRGYLLQALASWRQVVETEPLNVDAHRAIARLLAETEGPPACLEHLRQACDRFPHNYPLHQLWIEWLRPEGPQAVEPVARRILQSHPTDAWARRELAWALAEQGRTAEAIGELESAFSLEPANGANFNIQGQVFSRAGKLAEAKEAFRQAIRLSVDNDFAVTHLVQLCETLAERREALLFIRDELTRQVILGDGILAFRRHAENVLDGEEMVVLLRQGLAERPDLWQSWSALITQLTEMRRFEEAMPLARQAAERFSLLPRIWLDLAGVCRGCGEQAEELAALERAWQINSAWGEATWELASAYERQGKEEEAIRVLEQSSRRSPLDSGVHAKLADILWRQGKKDPALKRIQQALQCNSKYDWAWDRLREWTLELGRHEDAVAFARDLTARRPNDAHAWLMFAKMLPGENYQERIACMDRAIGLQPRDVQTYDLKAALLADAKEFDQALAACRPEALDPCPLLLRGRAAWVESQRGNIQAAAELMRQVLKEDANYYWGWYQLAEWSREALKPADYFEAGEQLVRLAPETANSFGFRGQAKLRMGNRKGAKEDLLRSIQMDPHYQFGWLTLFNLQLEDNEFEEVAKTIQVIRQSGNEQEALVREVHLHLKHRDRNKSIEAYRALCEHAEGPPWPL